MTGEAAGGRRRGAAPRAPGRAPRGGQAALLRRTRWRVAARAALLVTAVMGLLASAAYVTARRIVYAELRRRLELAAVHGGSDPDGDDRIAYELRSLPAGDPDPDGEGFFVRNDGTAGPTAFLRLEAPDQPAQWMAMPVAADLDTLRAFLAILGGLAVAGGLVALPAGYLLAGEALRPLDLAVRTRSEFVALASHRLRTPLSVIRTSADLALAGAGLDAPEALQTIREQTERMEGLAARLSALARVETRPAGPPSTLDLAAAAVAAVRGLGPAAAQAHVDLRCEPEPSRPVLVVAEPSDVDDALGSIVENAVQFTPAAGTVRVACGSSASWGWVEVRDEGPGIDPDDVLDLTRPFFQGRRARGGLGLGLAIAAAAVARARGRLEFEPGPEGRGATVRLLLPLARGARLRGTDAWGPPGEGRDG